MSKLGYAFTWLTSASNGSDDLDNIDEEQLREMANLIDWDKEPEYNRPDFDKDDLSVIKAKLKTVEDKLQKIIQKQ